MAIQTFTAAQVLTAAQMNALQANDYNQTVSAKVASYTLVAADKGTRITMSNASATTITVNTSLFAAGDSLRIQNIGAGVCTVTAGTATVNSLGPLAIAQWGGGQLYFTSASAAVWFPDAAAGGLTLIKSQTITPGASSVAVTDVFSATYEQYQITVTNVQTSAADAWLALQLGSTTTGYYGAAATANYATGNFTGAINFSNTSNFQYVFAISNPATNLSGGSVILSNPFATKRTTMNGFVTRLISTGYAGTVGGFQDSDTSFTGFTLIPSSGTITLGNISVYGLAR
jgi:hypothetical protein